jgi:hypothetical protein
MKKTLIYSCKWLTYKQTFKAYLTPHGVIAYDGKARVTETNVTLRILNEIASAINSQFGYTKIVYLNTAAFKTAFKTDNVVEFIRAQTGRDV